MNRAPQGMKILVKYTGVAVPNNTFIQRKEKLHITVCLNEWAIPSCASSWLRNVDYGEINVLAKDRVQQQYESLIMRLVVW